MRERAITPPPRSLQCLLYQNRKITQLYAISQVKIESNDGKYCIVFLRYEDENTGAIRLGIRWYYPTEKERDTAFSNLATSLADREG